MPLAWTRPHPTYLYLSQLRSLAWGARATRKILETEDQGHVAAGDIPEEQQDYLWLTRQVLTVFAPSGGGARTP